MSSRERLTVSLPTELVRDIRAAAGNREISAYIERAVRHEMLLTAPYQVPADVADDMQTLADEARGWTDAA